ncbi:MAG: YgiQ family radical SAM protein, partial [Tepidimonas sp.]|nr:YgiQ family radical SAM protein [Tepidimonas sp.]
AHYDYWSETVRRSILLDAKADLLLYGNAERALVEVAHRLARREPIDRITDVRGTVFVRRGVPHGWYVLDSTDVDRPGRLEPQRSPYEDPVEAASGACADVSPPDQPQPLRLTPNAAALRLPRERTVIRLPSYEQVKDDAVLYAHASRVLHLETNPYNARALVQRHGQGTAAQDVWINPPPLPLTTEEMDWVFGLPYARSPHPAYADARGRHDGPTKIPAWEMIRFSVNIMRGCFGGCTFCSITEHEGRIIQSRSQDSILREIEEIRDKVPGFTGVISDLGGPTANMWRLGCKSAAIEAACRKPSCVYPGICPNLRTDHGPLVQLYRRARSLPGIKKILIGSGLRYDLAVQSPEYVKELVQHHVGGYLKIAPEHTEPGPLSKMMKPGIGTYDRFKAMFDQYSKEAGKEQYLIPYFIAAHPGTSDEDMLNLALWLKRNGFRADQVQTFYPSPMATATAMYHTGLNPLKGIHRDERTERVDVVRGQRRRRLHKAFLRYHDPNNWPLLREALKRMGRADLIGNGKHHLVPAYQPLTDGSYRAPRRSHSTPAAGSAPRTRATGNSPPPGRVLTQHTGLPPRPLGSAPTPVRRAKRLG